MEIWSDYTVEPQKNEVVKSSEPNDCDNIIVQRAKYDLNHNSGRIDIGNFI